jgi:hypothetical protein
MRRVRSNAIILGVGAIGTGRAASGLELPRLVTAARRASGWPPCAGRQRRAGLAGGGFFFSAIGQGPPLAQAKVPLVGCPHLAMNAAF